MAKVKNISGEDRLVSEIGGRLVLDGQEIDVPDERAEGYVCQTETWAPVDEVAQAALDRHLAPPPSEDEGNDDGADGAGGSDD